MEIELLENEGAAPFATEIFSSETEWKAEALLLMMLELGLSSRGRRPPELLIPIAMGKTSSRVTSSAVAFEESE